MGAGDRPEFLDEETPIPEKREADARKPKRKRESKRGGRRRAPAPRQRRATPFAERDWVGRIRRFGQQH